MKHAIHLATLGIALARASSAMAECQIDSVSPVAFGTYDPLSSSALDTTGSLTYRCTVQTSVMIDLSAGTSGDIHARTLARAGGGALAYNLFSDAARTLVWGDTQLTRVGPISGTDVTVTVYGRVPANQDVEAGTYGDTITVTINF